VAAAGVKVCVASQGKPDKTELTLGITGLRGLFGADALFSAYSVPRGKPHPDLFLLAARSMGTSPGRTVVVEDTAIGVTGAVAAGTRVLGFAPDGDGTALTEAGAAEVLPSLADLPVRLGIG
jgi:beta-phosphoglucomutase-like phosphatase (HAD superfamily)